MAFLAKLGNSGINMKCNELLWKNGTSIQNGVCFLSSPHPSSLLPTKSHTLVKAPIVRRGSYVRAVIMIGEIYRGPRGLGVNYFFCECKDNNKSNFVTKFRMNWARITQTRHITCFGPINKIDNPQILCSPLFPEGVHLGRNALGVQSFSLVPSNKVIHK